MVIVTIKYRYCMDTVWTVYEKRTPTTPNNNDYGIPTIKKQDLHLNEPKLKKVKSIT
jgi:hypothetical protein